MKNLKILTATFLSLLLIFSCSKDESDDNLTIDAVTISAKWNVNQNSEFASFEFNESGNYIVVKNESETEGDIIILFGTYTITNGSTLVLSDFGTIQVTDISENSISFTLTLNASPDDLINISANKQAEMENTTRTDLLCRTWEMLTINGEDVQGTDMELTVLFSAAGTYFVTYLNTEDEDGGLAQWKWGNEAETQLLYSWDENPVWEEEDYVEIPEITTSKLVIIEDGETYVLQPVSNAKSGVIHHTSVSEKSRFFK